MADFRSDRWANGHGVVGGRKTFIRKNESLASTRKEDYPNLLLISLIYQEQGDGGLPRSEEELDRLDRTEEAVASRICSRFGALFALCVTRDGTRDLFLFLSSCPTDEEIAAELAACSPSVDFDFAVRHDPAWRPYLTMLPHSAAAATAPQTPWWRRLLGS
jgi:hypothetical protein